MALKPQKSIVKTSSTQYARHTGNPGAPLRLPPSDQVIVTQVLQTRGTPAREQGRGHPGRQIGAGDTPGDGGRRETPEGTERETHSPHPGPSSNKVRP